MDYLEIEHIAQERTLKKGQLSILLVSPHSFYIFSDWPVPPIGPAYVSAALKRAGKKVYTLNLAEEKGSITDIIQNIIRERDIDLIGFGALVSEWEQAAEVFQAAKQCNKEIITYLGGGSITCSPSEMMDLIKETDIGMIGEGEVTACEMVETLEQGGNLKKVNGLVLRESDGTLHFNDSREVIQDLDLLPWPDWEGFKFFDKKSVGHDSSKKIVCAPLVTSRGCPFRCTFCSRPTGNAHSERSMESIFAELDHLVKVYGVNRLFINDDVFAVPFQNRNGTQGEKSKYKSRLEEFCVRIRPYSLEWIVYLRVGEHMTDELLSLMKESGCVEIFYGIESGDDRVLRSMRKGITTDIIEDTVRRTHAAGIGCTGNFIFGDPAETQDTIKQTFAFADRLSDQFRTMEYLPIVLFPGSALYKKAILERKITDPVKFIRNGLPLINLTTMSDDEYRRLVWKRIPEQRVKRIIREEPSHRPQNLIIDFDTKKLYINHVCQRCGEKSKVYLNSASLTDYTHHSCEKCGQRADYLVMGNYAQIVDQYVEKLLHGERTAFWGGGWIYLYYQAFSKVLNTASYILTDNNLDMQLQGVAGHEVIPPSALKERGIRKVIVTARKYYRSIINDIEKNHPEIEEVYDFWELPFYNMQRE